MRRSSPDRDIPRAHAAVDCGGGIVGHWDRPWKECRRSDRPRAGVVARLGRPDHGSRVPAERQGIGWRLGQPRYLLIGYGLPLVECSIVYGLVWLIGLGGLRGDVAGAARTLVVITPGLLGGSFLALGEEIGWRGLLVPQLATLTTFTKTALISGGIQAVWHWPFVLFVGFTSAAPPWYALSILTVTVTLAGFAAAWLRLRSGSVWPVVLAHASFNLYVQSGFNQLTADTGVTEYIVDEFGVAFVLSGTVIAYVFWRLRHRLARSPQGDATPVATNDD